jgi:hypothetical protein
VLTGDPMSTSTNFIQASADRETLEQLSDDELLRQAAREVARAVCVVAKAMMVQAMVVVTRPAETALWSCESECALAALGAALR